MSDNPKGQCRLCGGYAVLQDSHIFPRFAYKNFVADIAKGGSFTDITSLRRHNKQWTDYWFCQSCEQRIGDSETYVSEFLREVVRNPEGPHRYERRLLTFATSISLRLAMAAAGKATKDQVKEPVKRWKQFLLGRSKSVGPFTQHAFIAFGEDAPGKDAEWHKSMGFAIPPGEGLIVSRIGPLLQVAFLHNKHLRLAELNTWQVSELSSQGGTLPSIAKNRGEAALTEEFARLLNGLERTLVQRSFLLPERQD